MTDAPCLTADLRIEGGEAIIAVVGEIDVDTAPLLAEVVERALASEAAVVCLDCTELRFIDSTGIHVLTTAWVELRERADGRAIYVEHLPPGPRRTLELCGVTGLLTRSD